MTHSQTHTAPDRAQAPAKAHLLTTAQMAEFATDGLLLFDELIPDEINQAAMAEIRDGRFPAGASKTSGGQPQPPGEASIWEVWPDSPGLGAMLRLPRVRGIIHSLVGPNPAYDLHRLHVAEPDAPGIPVDRTWHTDGVAKADMSFDIQLFYFPHDVPREMGGMMCLPGSHLRKVSDTEIARYQNFRTQMPVVCKAGTLLVTHRSLWRCARPNRSDRPRHTVQIRLSPRVRQTKLWNTDDLNAPGVVNPLGKNHIWYGVDDRLEIVNRILLWRMLIGDPKFDLGYWLSRLENLPENLPERP